MFSDVDESHAGNRRKLLLPTYSMSSVLEAESYIDKYTESLLKQFDVLADRETEFDLVQWSKMCV